ncbi:hypothetical protein [Oceanithermus sp.]|uniref:hypothetical protein n=1 Tax=Oceanithermus sp. TaxID=2268145 RepID=UPI00257D7359|nr:hypothetical protein [Oceanithermus sp.]
MPELLDRVIVEILGDDSKLKAALDRAERSATTAASKIEVSFERANRRALDFSQALRGLGRVIGPAVAGLGAYGLARAAYTWSANASQAEIATRLFRKQLERMGRDADAGTAKLEAVAERLGVLPQDLAEYSTQLLRQGLTMDEIATLFEGAAASALAAGKSTKEGIDAVTNAVVTQQSVYLNYAGIAENLNQAYKDMAKALGKSVEALTKEEKARAAVNLVMQATKEEVRDLDQLLGGMSGKQNALNKEWAEFRLELGERLIPAISGMIEVATEGLRALNGLFDWLDHVFGDKVKLAAEDAREEIRAVKRELGEARSADELIDKMQALSDTLSGPGKEAWQEYVAEAEKSKDSIKDISKAATEAIVKFLAVSSVTQEQVVSKAKDALMTAIERSGLSRDLVEYLKKAAERGGEAFAGTLAQVRKELSEQISRISGGTEVATLQRQRLLNQIELLNHLEGAVVPLRKAEAELAATQEEQARILKVLNGEVDTLRNGLSGGGSGGGPGGGGLANDAKEAATSFDRLTQSVLDFIKARRGIGAYGGTRASWGPGLGMGGALVAPRGMPGIAGGAPLLPESLWDFDQAAREAAQATEELNKRIRTITGTGSSVYGGTWGPGLGRGGAIVSPRWGAGVAGGAELPYWLRMFGAEGSDAKFGRPQPFYDTYTAGERQRRQGYSEISAWDSLTPSERDRRRGIQEVREMKTPGWQLKALGFIGDLGKSIRGVLSALNPFKAVLEKINPVGTIIQGMLEELEPVLEPIVKIFTEMGKTLGRVLAPALKLLTPVVQWLGNVLGAVARFVAGIWNAIARGLNAVLGWLGVNIPTIDLAGGVQTQPSGEGAPKPTWSGWGDATSTAATIGIAATTTPVVATPGWVHTFGGHVDRFGQYVARLVEEGIRVQVGTSAGAAPQSGIWDRAVGGALG